MFFVLPTRSVYIYTIASKLEYKLYLYKSIICIYCDIPVYKGREGGVYYTRAADDQHGLGGKVLYLSKPHVKHGTIKEMYNDQKFNFLIPISLQPNVFDL